MNTTSRANLKLRPHDDPMSFESNVSRYFGYALDLLPVLEEKCKEVIDAWPVGASDPIIDSHIHHPNLSRMVDERDRLSDSVRVYAAMAVEGFLNFYGTLRLTEATFNDHFERLGLVPKLRTLLLTCDHVLVSAADPLVKSLDEVAQSRNALVHPKVREVQTPGDLPTKPHSRVPDSARATVKNMELFFVEFATAVPDAKHLLPRRKP